MRVIVLSMLSARKIEELLSYLEAEWSEKVKANFIHELDNSLIQACKYPLSYEKSQLKPGLHRCVVNKQTTLYYKFDSKKIYVVTIFDTRQDPKLLRFK
jgi:plasmid stabilization system protein ParE